MMLSFILRYGFAIGMYYACMCFVGGWRLLGMAGLDIILKRKRAFQVYLNGQISEVAAF